MKNSFKGKQDVQAVVLALLSLVNRQKTNLNTEQAAECLIGVKPEIYGFNPFFGKLAECKYQEICNICDWLVKNSYLKYVNLTSGKLEITFRGSNFLISPKSFEMSVFAISKQIPFSIMNKLKEKRKEMAESAGIPVFRIASNHLLRLLAIYRPQTTVELFDMEPEILSWDYPTDWNAFLCCLQENEISAFEQISESMLETKKLIENGLSTFEIAKERKLSASTILWHLEVLHYHEAIDLTTWIENQVEPKRLKIQASYFKKSSKKKLSEASKYLKISFEEARLSRMYSWHQPVI